MKRYTLCEAVLLAFPAVPCQPPRISICNFDEERNEVCCDLSYQGKHSFSVRRRKRLIVVESSHEDRVCFKVARLDGEAVRKCILAWIEQNGGY